MTGDRDTVVVPALDVPSSTAAVRSLGRAGLDTVAVSSDPPMPSFSSKYCTETAAVPAPDESIVDYANALLGLAAREEVRTILPLREADIYALAKYRSDFAEYIDPVWPTFETLQTVQDRHRLLTMADEIGIPTPSSQLLTEWPAGSDPVVVKSRHAILVESEDSGARYPGVRTIQPESRPAIDDIIAEMGHVPLVQEFVPSGGEYGFFALFDRGDPVVTFQHHRIRSGSYTGGASVYREAVDIPTLEQYGLDLLSALDWHGPAMVEFRRDERDGSFRLMEINPRFWGSLGLPIHAGVDFPYYYYQLATGESVDTSASTYQTGVACHFLRGECMYLYNVATADEYGDPPPLGGEVVDIARSLYAQPNFDYLSVSDPGPFIADIRNTVRKLRSGVSP